MAFRPSSPRTWIACTLCSLIKTASTTPTIALPFNSQVPMVARVNQAYQFELSDSTFAPQSSNFTYSISDGPPWLALNSGSRVLSGVPDGSDTGAVTFTLTAADDTGAAHMLCTLVISTDPTPQMQGDISKQLAATANLSTSDPPVVTIVPSSPFTWAFEQDSFIDIVQRKLYYYATLTDHTPLPSWLNFDPQQLSFSGTAPLLSAMPQTWEVELLASDVVGFAGAAASFTVAIGLQSLAFLPSQQNISITAGVELNFTGLRDELFRDGSPLEPTNIATAQASGLPPWLNFDSENIALVGVVPPNPGDSTVLVTVTDRFGEFATAAVSLIAENVSLFSSSISALTAYTGQPFNYHFPDDLFSESNLTLSVILPPAATWLGFDSSSRVLEGTAPTQITPMTITATMMARSPTLPTGQTQPFTIDVKSSNDLSSSASQLSASPSNLSATSTLAVPSTRQTSSHLSGGVVAAIGILCIIAVLLLLACLLLCLRQLRGTGHERHCTSPVKKMTISRPILCQEPQGAINTTAVHTDIEKTAGNGPDPQAATDTAPAPQIALDLPVRTRSKRSTWFNRLSNISKVSSIGNGEAAIRSDTNIPEWGRESTVLHTPHDSFSVPAEMARVSRQLSHTSPTKRALQRLREARQSRQSVGLGIDTDGSKLRPQYFSRRTRAQRRGASDLGLSAAIDRSSQISLSTRGTSVLSTRPSDFPPPPTQITLIKSRSKSALSIKDGDNCRTIRVVARSDSVKDERPMAEKRQSFIRKRASTSLQSPLFSHGSRASSNTRQNGQNSAAVSSAGSIRRSRRGKKMLGSYSESSSLEPQGHSFTRPSSRVRSAFAPNFPRAVTRSDLGGEDDGIADESSSGFETVSSFNDDRDQTTELNRINESDAWREEMHRPRHQRNFVLPGEASPTPPPAPPTSRQASTTGRNTPLSDGESARQRWRDRSTGRTPSPLSMAIAVPVANDILFPDRSKRKTSNPLDHADQDIVNRKQRPRLVHTSSRRRVSVEEVKRLSSFTAMREVGTDTRAGGERWDDTEHTSEVEGSGLMPIAAGESKANTQKSNMSGPAFL